MDQCECVGVVGRRGSGKTTLLKRLAAGRRRVLFWDWRGEYDGRTVGLAEVPALLQQRSFVARYRPGDFDLVREFEALAHVLTRLGRNLTLVVDEVALVTKGYQDGGMGKLLRYTRPQGIDLFWATQRPTGIPGTLKSEISTFHVFHLHNRADLVALSDVLSEDDLRRVAALPPHAYITVTL